MSESPCASPTGVQTPELREGTWGRRPARGDVPLPGTTAPTSPYLLLLLLRDQVGVAVHRLFCFIFIPAALLVEPLGLGEPPDRAGTR